MRGADTTQEALFTVARLDDFVPAIHPHYAPSASWQTQRCGG